MKYTELDRAEAGRLKDAVQKIEALLQFGGGITSGNAPLSELLHTAEAKLAGLQLLEEQAVIEEKDRAIRDIEIALSIRYEAALSVEENRQYQEFLSREYFTQEDFGKLERFYGSAYDRLSEDGKAEMSHRVWEGVRRDEYEFSELPGNVKEKEAKRLRNELGKERIAPELQNIPVADRDDFISAWDAGDRPRSFEVLNRESFAENIALSSKTHAPETAIGPNTNPSNVMRREAAQARLPKDAKPARLDLDFDLSGIAPVRDAPVVAPLASSEKKGPAAAR